VTQPYTPIVPDTSNNAAMFPLLGGQGFLTTKTPVWSTAIATATSGRERRRQQWSYPAWEFKLSHEVLRAASSLPELQKLFGFFGAHAGRGTSWSYYDASDNLVTDQQFGTGNGSTRTFQLVRTCGTGNLKFTEPVRTILSTPKVSIGASDSPSSNWTIDSLGQITFTTAPANTQVLTWSGQFAFLCRFLNDRLDATQMMDLLWSQSGLGFVTVKR
jgi:uncharacterized protein (TIGR02217 family)